VARYASSEALRHHVLVPAHGVDEWEGDEFVIAEAVYGGEVGFAPPMVDLARVFFRLVRKRGCDAVHFCFAPNPRSCRIGRAAMRRRRQPSVHTVLSVPSRFDGIADLLFSDRVVAVSKYTADRLVGAGVENVSVVAVSLKKKAMPPEGAREERPRIVFPGDYEFSRGAEIFARAVARIWRESDAEFVFACRNKTPASAAREEELRGLLAPAVAAGSVRFAGEVPDILALLASARAVVFPAESTYAKMDIPLVVLEAMAMGTPVVLADVDPLRECLGDSPEEAGGILVPALDVGALADVIAALVKDPRGARERGLCARRHVEAYRDAAIVCAAYLDLYADL
jgi:phosphatidylinositol alpha-1,6-mannosyltransferase